MRRSNNGGLVLGTIGASNGTYSVTDTQVGKVGSEWNFHTTNPATVT